MIRIKRNRKVTAIHPKFTGDEFVTKLLLLAQARLDAGDAIAFKGKIGDWKDTKDQLKSETTGKCAYCEAATEHVAHGDVEHFRPKSLYWWLALCIDNYVYSCQLCNQTYKRKKFPISGTMLAGPRLPAALPTTKAARARLASTIAPDPRATTDAAVKKLWKAEQSDLPHPYLEDPEPLFAWSVSEVNEEVLLDVPQHASARATRAFEAARDYLGLNRETLRKQRYFVFCHLRFKLLALKSADRSLHSEAQAGVQQMCESRQPFAGMCRFFTRQAGFAV